MITGGGFLKCVHIPLEIKEVHLKESWTDSYNCGLSWNSFWKGYFEDYDSNTGEGKVIGSRMSQNMYNFLKIYWLK